MTSALPVSSVIEQHHPAITEIACDHRMVWVGAVGLLLLGPLAFGATEPWSQFVLECGAACLFASWAIRETRSQVMTVRWAPPFLPMLAFALLVLLQLAFHLTTSTERTLSSGLLFTAYGTLCFLLIQSLRRPQQLEWAARMISVYGATLALFGLVQGFTSNGKLYWLRKPYYEGWIYGPYVNHNHYAGLMEMLTPIPLVIALSPRSSVKNRWLAGIAAAVMATSILFSASRGGMMAFAGELLLLALLVARHVGRRKTLVMLFAFVCLIALLAAWLGLPQIVDRFATFHSQARTEISDGMRINIDRDALKMIPQRPLLGWGLGSFVDVYPQFRSFYTNLIIDHAHNDYLELLVETGVAGFAIAAWFLLAVCASAWTKLRQSEWDTVSLAALASVAAVAGVLIHGLVDFNLQIPANAAIFYGLCTVAAINLDPGRGTPRRERSRDLRPARG
ncbi:MAG TPA: O-antigen ligase family protein [Terriglobales bacterium]